MLASGTDIKETIQRQYDEVIRIFDDSCKLPASLHETVEKVRERVIQKRKEFSEEICQVVVSGEISAGKSSLLNFLIGKDILPTSLFESRSVPCRLRYSTEKRAKLLDVSGNVIEDINYEENENKEALNRLKKIIEGSESVLGLSYVEIFLNEASLEGNVVLVYTPGIKEEDDDDNTQLFTHLQKASAFLYIIKTDSAGGTHKLLKIRNWVKELKQDGDSKLNPDCMLYVCNRWDIVDEDEEQNVFEEIQSRLRGNGIEVREGQLLKLSEKVGLALTAPLWFPIAISAGVFVVPVSALNILLHKIALKKAESNFRVVTAEHHLVELLQELYKLDAFSEARFNEEFEKNLIRLFNQWLDQQHQEFKRVIEDIADILQQLAQDVELEIEDKQSVDKFLQQIRRSQEECCVISEMCCNLLNEGTLG